MSIYAMADLHLTYGTNKPMNIFGNVWEDYEEKLKQNWISKITDQDTVLLPGDFSWGISLEESLKDFEFINKLPGRKILLKGNHDYWWTTLKKMNKFIEDNGLKNIEFLYNNAIKIKNIIGPSTIELSRNASFNPKKTQSEVPVRSAYPILFCATSKSFNIAANNTPSRIYPKNPNLAWHSAK